MKYGALKLQIKAATDCDEMSRFYRAAAGCATKRLRVKKGLSIRGLAKQLDISCSMLCKIENKKAIPSIQLLNKIADWASGQ